MYNVHATWGMKFHSPVKDGASKDFYFFFDEFNYSGKWCQKLSFYNCVRMSGKGEDPWTQTPIDPPLPHQFKSVLHAPQLPLTKRKIDLLSLTFVSNRIQL